MGSVYKTWSGGNRTYLDGDNVRFGRWPRWPRRRCFSRVEVKSLRFGFAFHFFADVLVPAGSRYSLLCSTLLTSFLSHVFQHHFCAGITVSLFLVRAGHRWEGRLVSSTCRRRTCSIQSIVSIYSLSPKSTTIPSNLKSVHEKVTHTFQTQPPTPPPHLQLLPSQ